MTSIKDLKEEHKAIHKLANDQYTYWMNKGAANNLILPLKEEELLISDTIPLNKYLGFLEDIVDESLKFKEELVLKKEIEAIKQAEREAKELLKQQDNKLMKGRMRLNAHPIDVQKDLDSLKNSQSKLESSMAYRKTAVGSDMIDRSPNAKNSLDELNLTGGITLPSIFNNKRFEKELTQIELTYNEEDYLETNKNILDLRKLKKRNVDIFKERSNSYHMNNSYSAGFENLPNSSNNVVQAPGNVRKGTTER